MAIVATSRAALISSTLTSDSPMWRILPSSCSALNSPTWSSSGYAGVDAVQLEEVDRSTPSRRRLSSHCWRRYGRVADRRPVAGALPGQAGLGRDHQVVGVRMERLLDQLLGDLRAVGVGGVEEVDAELDRPAEHRASRLSWSLPAPHTPWPGSCMVP